jgi:hypothetical protein
LLDERRHLVVLADVAAHGRPVDAVGHGVRAGTVRVNTTTARAPSAAYRLHKALPMPLAPPVTTATLPFRST